MEPVFTLQWPEFIAAERLRKLLPRSRGYSILLPASRQEKGFDLAILKKDAHGTSIATIQVKASRTYRNDKPSRESTKRYLYGTWFNRFEVPAEADFILLLSIYAPDVAQTKRIGRNWYSDVMMLFTREEMRSFIEGCKTVGGRPDKMFSFGFNDEKHVVQTRGDPQRQGIDFSDRLLARRLESLKSFLQAG